MKRQPIAFILVPALTMLVVWPPVRELPPLMFTENFNALQVLIAAPFWLGVAAAPGYLYVWSGRVDFGTLTPPLHGWLAASLWGALVASIAGTIVSLPAIVPVPLAAGSAVCASFLLVRFCRFAKERSGSAA